MSRFRRVRFYLRSTESHGLRLSLQFRERPVRQKTEHDPAGRDLSGPIELDQFQHGVPLHVEYSLTEAGKAMLRIYYEMAKWGSVYLGDA